MTDFEEMIEDFMYQTGCTREEAVKMSKNVLIENLNEETYEA